MKRAETLIIISSSSSSLFHAGPSLSPANHGVLGEDEALVIGVFFYPQRVEDDDSSGLKPSLPIHL